MKALKQGFLLTLEGGEGGGKTTQIADLKEKLLAEGYEVVAVREPGGTEISEQIREVVLSSKNKEMAFTTEVLLFQAARAQIYQEIVIPALKDHKIVLMDRSRDSSVVYQGIVRGFGREFVEQLNDISTQKTMPNLTILFDVPVEIGLQRRAQTNKMDRLDSEKKDFHDQVRKAYLDLAKEDKTGRWVILDASQSQSEVAEALWHEVMAKKSHLI
jgi:dTMP kinase